VLTLTLIGGNIVLGHAFSVLDVKEVEGFRLLRLRNPWGKTESTLDWSDESDMWTKNPLVASTVKHEDKDDGEFWIDFEETDRVRFRVRFSVRFGLCEIFLTP